MSIAQRAIDATTPRIVREADVEKALDFLRDSAFDIGKAKARSVAAGHMLKHTEALCFKMSDATSNDRRQADARTHPKYVEAILEDAEAAGALATMYSLREAAVLKIEAWRSESATFRSMKL